MTDFHGRKRGGNGGTANGPAAADLIGSMASELAQLARRNGFDALGYLLDMARLEADNLTHGLERPDGAAN